MTERGEQNNISDGNLADTDHVGGQSYADKGGHKKRGDFARTKRAENDALPGLHMRYTPDDMFTKPIQESWRVRRFMRRIPNDGRR